MPIFTVYPLTDARWDELIDRHPRASVFHTSSWLSALQRTYGYEPLAFTTSPPGEQLKNGLVFCKVKSWITGRRLVSLPFSDHCDLLADSRAERDEMLAYLCGRIARDGYEYAEIRPLTREEPASLNAAGVQPAKTFVLHKLLLDVPVGILFRNLHRSCIQRKIKRAEREALTYESGRSEALLHAFYDLQLRTRRRHCIPPQPLRWFRNLMEAMGENLTIRLVSTDHNPVAAILTL